MATGYDYKFLDPVPDALVCLICTFVAREPQQTVCCGKVYCKDCLSGLKKHSTKCPQCREELQCFPDKRSDRDIKNLKVHCENMTKGCIWTGELLSLDKHSSECPYFYCPCPNKCENKLKILRKDMYEHLLECPKRLYACPHCKIAGEYQERTTTHLNECPKIKVECSNDGCSMMVCREEMLEHKLVCLYTKVGCRYAGIGCECRVAKKDLAEHENSSQLHLQLALDSVLRLQSICSSLMCGYKMAGNLPIFKFVKFGERKAAKAIIYSPPFLTNPGGYKLCFQVCASGNTSFDSGRGTHVAILAFLMRGENDNHLSWPFTGTVTIELLNQLEDKGHHFESLDFSKYARVNKRVLDGERAELGCGYDEYIAHSSLGYDSARRCQYLMNDCLFFRIKTEPISDPPKPWLSVANTF